MKRWREAKRLLREKRTGKKGLFEARFGTTILLSTLSEQPRKDGPLHHADHVMVYHCFNCQYDIVFDNCRIAPDELAHVPRAMSSAGNKDETISFPKRPVDESERSMGEPRDGAARKNSRGGNNEISKKDRINELLAKSKDTRAQCSMDLNAFLKKL